ncbi:MAG: Chemotaxis protein CheW [Candidatus Methanoperedenaceae archaeon GB37]|nr:Chemotaxis protein CheW [Candidatus Methanoperedenaceae archaeon GB37]CAD7783732.1 MAG: Chemotaxis protein CheW [Candidatus Methanoperedenaceae archaeon GB37]
MEENKEKTAEEVEGYYLTFCLADEVYGVNALKVKEVTRFQRATRIPRLSPVVKGIINLRGTILPIFDLRAKFDLEPRKDDTKGVIVVVEILGRVMGVLVDDVIDVIYLEKANLQLSPPLSP